MKEENSEFVYHGTAIDAPYFEGWYFKVSTDTLAFAIIAGIAKHEQEEHAFIQTIDTKTRQTKYVRYTMEEVEIQSQPFFIRIANNYFSQHHVILDVEEMKANITMYACTELKTSSYAPTIMGPFSYWKHMQCVHSIISLHHFVRGTLQIDGDEIPIAGIGYMEKDRGVSFPKEYIWTQSNKCALNNSCFFLSIAHIPLGGMISFTGCICVLMIKQKQYRFTTYHGTRIRDLSIRPLKEGKEVTLYLHQFSYLLHIKITQYQAYPLLAPQDGIMEPKVFESLESKVEVILYHRGNKIQELHFEQAGTEIRM